MKNQRTRFLLLARLMAIALFTSCVSFAGTQKSAHEGKEGTHTGGGGESSQIDLTAIRLLLEGEGLKNALLHYLNSIQVDRIADPSVKRTFERILRDGAIQRDIRTPGNYVAQASCVDAYDHSVSASAGIADAGGKICFDAEKIAREYSRQSAEELMIRLASLALHEHVHHFQKTTDSPAENESEAYRLSAYVQVTAKVEQVPLLKWEPSVAPQPKARSNRRTGYVERVESTEDSLEIDIQYHQPMWLFFRKELRWFVGHQCIASSQGIDLNIQIEYEEVSPCLDCQTQDVSFPTKTFEFEKRDLCWGNYQRLYVNGTLAR